MILVAASSRTRLNLSVPQPETMALDLTCAECGRSPRAGETWRILFADIREAATYCPQCAEREFGERSFRWSHGSPSLARQMPLQSSEAGPDAGRERVSRG
jgi:hypothetical protein